MAALATTEPEEASAQQLMKIGIFEDDDEFEEFAINEELEEKKEGMEIMQQWEDDWDDDDVNDDFSLQVRKELQSNAPNK